jgi:hypothetical protein
MSCSIPSLGHVSRLWENGRSLIWFLCKAERHESKLTFASRFILRISTDLRVFNPDLSSTFRDEYADKRSPFCFYFIHFVQRTHENLGKTKPRNANDTLKLFLKMGHGNVYIISYLNFFFITDCLFLRIETTWCNTEKTFLFISLLIRLSFPVSILSSLCMPIDPSANDTFCIVVLP